METFARGKGAYAGPVTAVISEPASEFDAEKGDVKKSEVKVLEKYKNYDTSGLKYEIEKKITPSTSSLIESKNHHEVL